MALEVRNNIKFCNDACDKLTHFIFARKFLKKSLLFVAGILRYRVDFQSMDFNDDDWMDDSDDD